MEITRELAAYAVQSRYESLPSNVQHEATRAFVNWLGCVWGGCSDPAVDAAERVQRQLGGRAQARVIGRGLRTDMAGAALLNCLSSCVHSFDDTHLATVTHPTGPVASALFSYCEMHAVSGAEFANALALGIEIECRISNMLLLPPAVPNLGLFITGISGPVGAAAALGRLMRFDVQTMCSAMGLAASQAAGLRATHGGMSAFWVPAHAARTGVVSAMLAATGFSCPQQVIEGPKGLVATFSPDADPRIALNGLGTTFEILANAYKPYPAGIVIQPAIDACLALAPRIRDEKSIRTVTLRVHPLAIELCGRRHPADAVQAQISLFHWAAACLIDGAAGLAQLHSNRLAHPAVQALRAVIDAQPDALLRRDEAYAEVTISDGTVLQVHIANARGSTERPLTDAELDAKFLMQTSGHLGTTASTHMLAQCRDLPTLCAARAAIPPECV